ncbi:DUF1707 SHOCT-like domain-containing protein [Agromyces sp. NPDC004153]
MSGYASPDRPDQRLSDAERDEAVGRLGQAHTEGRLTTEEYGERSASARRAVTRADLVPLFADLPESPGAEQAVPIAATPGPVPPPPPAPGYGTGTAYPASQPVDVDRDRSSGSRALGGRVGATIMALVPFLAVALFFITGFMGSFAWSWLWFLLVPIAGIVIYGPGSDGRRSRR